MKKDHIIKTGIKGFDKLIEGGFPINKCILLSGTPGTGKTIFSLQYLYNGATLYNEKGLYVSLEESSDNLMSQADGFGWDFKKLEKQGKVTIMSIPVSELKENTVNEIIKYVKKHKIKRLVIDSLSALAINVPSSYSKITDINDLFVKRFMYNFINDLRKVQDVTSLLINQTTDHQLSRDGVSEFITDGIILIKYESLGGEYSRTLIVRKMREVKNNEDLHPLEIGKKGIVVHDLR